jgi:hypothetical protein
MVKLQYGVKITDRNIAHSIDKGGGYLLVDELQTERVVELLLAVVIVDHGRLPVVAKVAELI